MLRQSQIRQDRAALWLWDTGKQFPLATWLNPLVPKEELGSFSCSWDMVRADLPSPPATLPSFPQQRWSQWGVWNILLGPGFKTFPILINTYD